MTKHVVIMNWNEHARGLLATLRPKYETETAAGSKVLPVVLVAGDERDLSMRVHDAHTRIVTGNPYDRKTLEEADVAHAGTVILLADRNRERHQCDNRTLILSLAINHHLRARGLPTILDSHDHRSSTLKGGNGGMVRIVAEVLDPANAHVFKQSRITGLHEVICEDDLGLRILAQCTESPGVGWLLGDLLDRSKDSSEIHQVALPDHVAGDDVDSMRVLLERVYGNDGLDRPPNNRSSIPLVIGFMRWRHGLPNLVINPRNKWFQNTDWFNGLQSDDKLLVICKGGADPSTFRFPRAETSVEIPPPEALASEA